MCSDSGNNPVIYSIVAFISKIYLPTPGSHNISQNQTKSYIIMENNPHKGCCENLEPVICFRQFN